MTVLELVCYILEFITVLFLIPTNIFIVIVNLLTWIKDKKFSQVEQLITSISVCNFVEEMLTPTYVVNIIYDSPKIKNIYFALSCMVLSCNVWFSTFLCVYFCLKIVNVKNTLYMCLQRNFQKILPWLFVSAILGSVLVSVPFILIITEENVSNPKLNTSAINWQSDSTFISFKERDILFFLTLSWIALLILSISTLVIVTSLFKHMNQVQQNLGGFRSPNMKIHVQALRTIMSLLFSNIIILLVLTANLSSNDNMWSYVIIPLYFMSKVVVCWSLIKGNRNLDKTLRNIFSKSHCINTSDDNE
ncbi:taste receptor type 2 member 43-like [Engystomops pustulosus]|uniref:taste receptor type 2 member 43-like n=1 Tax=Engystomops pustulosus TaxID=76066 RepID=UPI003AFAC186